MGIRGEEFEVRCTREPARLNLLYVGKATEQRIQQWLVVGECVRKGKAYQSKKTNTTTFSSQQNFFPTTTERNTHNTITKPRTLQRWRYRRSSRRHRHLKIWHAPISHVECTHTQTHTGTHTQAYELDETTTTTAIKTTTTTTTKTTNKTQRKSTPPRKTQNKNPN